MWHEPTPYNSCSRWSVYWFLEMDHQHAYRRIHIYPSLLAVLKFKRRTRFLGFYVQVLAKALQEGLTETALDWTNDTMTWIVR